MRKFIILLALSLISVTAMADSTMEIRDILKQLETNGDIRAIGDSGRSYGVLQIQSGVILDVNKECGTTYTHEDAFDEVCANEIFELYIQKWTSHLEYKENRVATEADIVRIWNGGPQGYKRTSTLAYLVRYYEFKENLTMNKRKCIINGKLGIITGTYTHTMDVFLCKTKTRMTGVSKSCIRILPKQVKPVTNQLKLQV